MRYLEALQFIQAASWRGSCLGLERMNELMHRLGDPQKSLKFIHVAGTNGKGSVCAMLASILSAAGYRTGLYTSPHLRIYNERIRIGGENISDENFNAAADTVRCAVEGMEDIPTEFERITAMAFWYFAQQRCDIVVCEVGLGGRLDATNVIDTPELAVITCIDLEHTEILGDTIEKIAIEKAGIIKRGTSVVLYQQSKEAECVIQAKCQTLECSLTMTDASQEKLFESSLDGQILRKLRLLGSYQRKNAALVLEAVDALRQRGWLISEAAVQDGFALVTWPGRFEILRQKPLVIVDGAHNPNSVRELAACIREYLPERKLVFIMGVMADKNYGEMLEIISPYAERFIAVEPDNGRALPADELARTIESTIGLPACSGGSVYDGMARALDESGDDVICAFGS